MAESNIAAELEVNDRRIEFLAEFTLKTLKQKTDKFIKLYAIEEAKLQILDFLEKTENNLLIIQSNSIGTLQICQDWPGAQKLKGVFFMKKKDGVPKEYTKEQIRNMLIFGDVSQLPIDQIAGVIDTVCKHCFQLTG